MKPKDAPAVPQEAAKAKTPAPIPSSGPVDLVGALDRLVEGRIEPSWPARSNHASAIGHPCARYLTYSRVISSTDKHSVRLERIFALGKYHGNIAARELAEALENDGSDWEAVMQEAPVAPNRWEIGGRVDVWLVRRVGGKALERRPVEIKSVSEMMFQGLKDIDSLKRHRYVHIRKWPVQLMTYMALEKVENGIILLRNRGSGEYRQIDVTLDMAVMDEAFARCDEVNKAVRAYNREGATEEEKELCLPKRINYAGDVCGECEFRSLCVPDLCANPSAVNLMWDVELEATLCMMEELEDKAMEYTMLDNKVKAHCEAAMLSACPTPMVKNEKRTIVTAGHTIVCSCRENTSFPGIPDHVKAPYKKTNTFVVRDIKKIGDAGA
jgi:hypothetical protein